MTTLPSDASAQPIFPENFVPIVRLPIIWNMAIHYIYVRTVKNRLSG